MQKILFVWFILLDLILSSYGYSSGPPTSTCTGMTPSHGPSAQTSQAPYTIATSSATYKTDGNITVTITATSGSSPFKGFFIQSRSSGSDNPVGRFYTMDTDNEVQLMTCTGGSYSNNAAVHASGTDKTSKQFLWNNPDGGADVYFQGTFVNIKATFWTGVVSSTISESIATTTAIQATTTQSQGVTTAGQGVTTSGQGGATSTQDNVDTTTQSNAPVVFLNFGLTFFSTFSVFIF